MPRAIALVAAAFAVASASPGQSAPREANTPEQAADARDKMVCKRFIKTGSLADSYRTCKTKGEWDRERDNARQFSVSDSCRLRADPSRGEHTHDC